jgi:DNA-nicking Smr family endonuclease
MPIRAGRSKNDSTDDDAAAFAEAVSGTRRLGGAARISPAPGGHAGRRLPPSRPALPPATGAMSINDGGDTWTARADGVDLRILRRLRAGDVPIEARLDLHGLTRALADRAVDRFVAASRAARRRCILIIHGRGLHSGSDGPALRDFVRGVLTAGGLAGAVLACCTAPPRLGGSGATLVLLRR